MTTEHQNHEPLTQRATFVVEKDEADYAEVDAEGDALESPIKDFCQHIVVNEVCSTAGWTEDDVVCRCNTKREAERIAKLLTEHGLS